MIGCFVTSLDNPEKRLVIETGNGSQTGDIFFNTNNGWISDVHLTAFGIGTGNYNYKCPIYKACQDVLHLFQKNEQDVLIANTGDKELFQINAAELISYGTPDWYSSPFMRLDLLRSTKGFTGIRARQALGDLPEEEHIVWLCGPENKEYAQLFGEAVYQKRRELFGHIYDMAAATDPIQMTNPIFPGENGMNCITRGLQNA